MPEPVVPPSLASALADRYHLVRPLGEGGMASVYLAEARKHDRKVAITSLDPDGSEWTDHGVFPGARVSHRLLQVDEEGRLYWMESAVATYPDAWLVEWPAEGGG